MEERTAELNESRERAQLRNESVPHMVWSVFSDGIGEYFNRRTLYYLGKTTEEMERLRWMEVVHADDVAKAAQEWADMVGGGQGGLFRTAHSQGRGRGVSLAHRPGSADAR